MVVGSCSYKQTEIQTDPWECKPAGIISTEVGNELINGSACLQSFLSRIEGLCECKCVCVCAVCVAVLGVQISSGKHDVFPSGVQQLPLCYC